MRYGEVSQVSGPACPSRQAPERRRCPSADPGARGLRGVGRGCPSGTGWQQCSSEGGRQGHVWGMPGSVGLEETDRILNFHRQGGTSQLADISATAFM